MTLDTRHRVVESAAGVPSTVAAAGVPSPMNKPVVTGMIALDGDQRRTLILHVDIPSKVAVVVLAKNDEIDVSRSAGSFPGILLIVAVKIVAVPGVWVLGVDQVKVRSRFISPSHLPEVVLVWKRGTVTVDKDGGLDRPQLVHTARQAGLFNSTLEDTERDRGDDANDGHDHEWFRLDKQHQHAALHRIGVILKQADYNGAKLRDSRGNLVAEWIRGVGEFVYDFAPPEPKTNPVEDPDPGRQPNT